MNDKVFIEAKIMAISSDIHQLQIINHLLLESETGAS